MQLKVYYSKPKINKAFIAVVLSGLFSLPHIMAFFPSQNAIGQYLPKFMQNFIFFGLPFIALLLGSAIIYAIFFCNLEAPVLILNERGMWVKELGFISWDNVETIGSYTSRSPKMLGVWVKDIKKVFKQASNLGKFSIIYSKIFSSHPVTFKNLNMKNESIVAFAQQYIN